MYPDRDRTAWIVSQRPARSEANPFKPSSFFMERELSSCGRILESAGILLTNRECPWRCLMCDLWKNTLTYTVPLGAIPGQIEYALSRLGVRPEQLKLYNSGSFFDPAAIPLDDYAAIASSIGFARHVIVESHPRLIGPKVLKFRDLLAGSLEVAMGLETAHPEVLERLNKRFTLEQFACSVAFLRNEGIEVRAFVLVQPPFLAESEAIEWAIKSVRFAFSCGVNVVSLIPTRPGNGALDRLMDSREFTPPSLFALEQSLEQALELRAGRVFADTWDLQRFSNCASCFRQREERLQAINLSQAFLPVVPCPACDEAGKKSRPTKVCS